MNTLGPRFFAAALIVLLGIWAGIRMHSVHNGVAVSAGRASAPDPRDVATSDATGPHAVIPARLPDFSLKDLAGNATPISAWSGKSLMINFWATWCAPCRREIPLLKTIAAEWALRDLAVVGIAVDYRDKVKEFAGQFKIDYPVLIGDQDALDVAAQFGMASPAFPFTVFTDGRGEVVALFVGELHRQQVDFILSEVQDLNHGRVQLPEARRLIAEGLEKLADKRGA
jgi:thiol-disulfide isomerase/thioredoxin